MTWMLYGAYGFTGRLVLEEALRRGHRPILAGRDAEQLRPLAKTSGLDYRVFNLDSLPDITQHLHDIDLVMHVAGPHLFTSNPMIQACLVTGTHYLDITGEIPVFENSYTYDEAAQQQGCAIICGVGFDVVPTNCLALYVADQLPDATHLEIALDGVDSISAGTAKTAIAGGSAGGWVRRNHRLMGWPLGAGAQHIRFSHGERLAMPVPWGDLASAYQATGIRDITAYMAVPAYTPLLARLAVPVGQVLLSIASVRAGLSKLAEMAFKGPTQQQQQQDRAYIWARATNAAGQSVEAWQETPEAYRFTALACVQAVEHTLRLKPTGALAPAQAFGADFALTIDGVQRWDTLPDA